MTRSYTPSQIADGLLSGKFARDSAFVPLPEVERLRADAADIATIAHSGGLTGLSEAEALVAIRRLTLREWADRHGRTGSRQVRSALEDGR